MFSRETNTRGKLWNTYETVSTCEKEKEEREKKLICSMHTHVTFSVRLCLPLENVLIHRGANPEVKCNATRDKFDIERERKTKWEKVRQSFFLFLRNEKYSIERLASLCRDDVIVKWLGERWWNRRGGQNHRYGVGLEDRVHMIEKDRSCEGNSLDLAWSAHSVYPLIQQVDPV